MDMHTYNKWIGMPKFKTKIIDVGDGNKAIQLIYGHLNSETEIVNTCFSYPESPEDLALALECACNSLMKSFYLPQKDIINAISQRKES